MGLGDDMMWRGEAYQIHKRTGRSVRPVRKGRLSPRKESRVIWQDAEWIQDDGDVACETHPNQGKRWYNRRTPYRPKIAPYQFTTQEQRWWELNLKPKQPYIIINPTQKKRTKCKFNKHWPYFKDLMLTLPRANYVHLTHAGQHEDVILAQTHQVYTPSARQMMIAIKYAHVVITTEGAVHHAAGNFSIPTVVIRGSCIGSKTTGYANQINIERKAPCNEDARIGCHTMSRCQECERTMQSIDVQTVQKALEKCLALRDIDELNCK